MSFKKFKVYVLYLVNNDGTLKEVMDFPTFDEAFKVSKKLFSGKKIAIKEFSGDRLDLYFENKNKKNAELKNELDTSKKTN